MSKNKTESLPDFHSPEAILHLAGEQSLPIYFGIMQFKCPVHVIAVTEQTQHIGQTLRKVSRDKGLSIKLLVLDAYDLQSNIQRLRKYVVDNPAQWVFNLTGGTKPMFAAAYQVAQSGNYPSFYIETNRQTLSWIGPASLEKTGALLPALDKIDTFIRLAGYSSKISPALDQAGFDDGEGQRLLETMWSQRKKLGSLYRNIAHFNRYPGVPFSEKAQPSKGMIFSAVLKGPDTGYAGTLTINGISVTRTPWPDLAQFITGGWFEYYIFQKLKKLTRDGTVTDIIQNLLVTGEATGDHNPLQELDIAFTDGYRLTIIECKAGEIDQSHVQKLENLCRRFGGHFGRGILIAAKPESLEKIRERVSRSDTVTAMCADSLVVNPGMVMKCKPGEIIFGKTGFKRL